MRRPVVSLLLLTLLMLLSLTGAALGQSLPETTYASPTDCYGCHVVGGYAASAPVDFASAATVDLNACTQCHGPIPFAWWDDHAHNGESYCGPFCHAQGTQPTFSEPAGTVIERLVLTPYGRFQSLTSPNASAATVHAAHTGNGWVATTFDSIDPWCLTCHGAASCSACHTAAVAHGSHGDSPSCTAAGCHTLSGSDPAVPGCVDCHPDGQQETHAVSHAGTDGSLEGIACTSCHELALLAEHSKSTSSTSTSSCAACHPQPADGTSPSWDGTCVTAGCHTLGSSAPMHAQTTASHAVSTTNEMCLDCHDGTELGSVHVGAEDPADGSVSCLVCHKPSSPPVTGECAVCHFTFGEHYDPAAHASATFSCGGDGCHDVLSGLMAVHEQRNGEFDCWGCHNSVRSDVQSAIDNGLTGCGDCHSSMTATGGHRSVHWPTPLLSDASGPHYSYYTGSAGDAPTNDCIGCHTQNLVDEHMGLTDAGTGLIIRLPRLDSSGATLTCDTCHGQPEGSAARLAIANGLTSCESCHSVHGPLQLVHDSSFVDVQEVPCADCHSADLRSEHNGTYTSSAGLTGCDVCHALYESEMAATVQYAIAVGNSTACDACHASYHTDSEAHTAVAAESLGCASCHDSSATTGVDATAVHSGAAVGPCNVCHASQRLGGVSGHTAECASCHSSEGADYHRVMDAGHTFGTMGEGCQPCHAANLPEAHEPYLSRYPQYADTCALCHKNDDPARVPAGATANCDDCHDIHGDIDVIHTATSSQACVACHETGLVLGIHTKSDGTADCGTCHAAPAGRIDWSTARMECASCHGALSPVDPQHYPVASHTTTLEAGCPKCHSADLRAEHFKATVSPSVTCVSCHEQRVDNFTTSWDNSCTACHASKHGNQAQAHRSSNTSCTGSGCHVVTDVSVLHGTACETCHAPGITPSTDCTKCHTGSNPHHVTITLNMSTSSQWQTVCGSCHGRVHSWGSGTCSNCHSRDMHGESAHISRNSNCAVCHKVAAVDASDNCLGCHNDLSSSSGGGWGDGGGWGGGSTNTSGAVSGTITDSGTGAAISGATVTIAGKSTTSGNSGTYTVSNVTAGTYTMTVTATGYGAWSGSITVSSGSTLTRNVALAATAPTLTNLARGGVATASSTSSSSYASSKAIDGNTSTYWRSGSSGTQWLRLDFGSVKTFSKVIVNWNSYGYARYYRVETSSDGTNWAQQFTTSSGNGGIDEIAFTAVSARYVRVYCWSGSSDYRINEFEVWGY